MFYLNVRKLPGFSMHEMQCTHLLPLFYSLILGYYIICPWDHYVMLDTVHRRVPLMLTQDGEQHPEWS
jgi:hypothetical protein